MVFLPSQPSHASNDARDTNRGWNGKPPLQPSWIMPGHTMSPFAYEYEGVENLFKVIRLKTEDQTYTPTRLKQGITTIDLRHSA